MNRTSTETAKAGKARRAALYRSAARLIESGEEKYSCCAVGNVYSGYRASALMPSAEFESLPPVVAYAKAMLEGDALFTQFHDQDERALALCFMAAMVEAGDA
jgi:hypothetical protein